jgi:hypothetical protein
MYRIVLDENHMATAVRILKANNTGRVKKRVRPLFTKMTPYHPMIECHTSDSEFRKKVMALLKEFNPMVLRAPAQRGKRHFNRFGVKHPYLGFSR